MSASDVLWLAIGLALGWITKIPFLLHIYRDMDKKYEEMKKMYMDTYRNEPRF